MGAQTNVTRTRSGRFWADGWLRLAMFAFGFALLAHAGAAAAVDASPLYRFYNTRTATHFYTTDAAERDHVLATWPWFTYEGIAYYVYTSSTPSGGGTGVAKTDAWRLLNQATFGATEAEVARVTSMGIAAWIDDQFTQPVSGYADSKYNKVQLSQTPDCT